MDCNYAPPSPIVLPRSSTSCQLTCFLFSFVPLQDGSWFYYLGCDIRDWWGQTRTTLILTSRYCTILWHLKQCGNEVHPWRPSSLVRMFIKRDSSAVLVPVCKSVGHYPPSAMRRVFFLVSNHVNLPRVCVCVFGFHFLMQMMFSCKNTAGSTPLCPHQQNMNTNLFLPVISQPLVF